ncbi:helical backbone metal receptor [Lipingzhangella sp. LS1_29]|uniref:Helical backbone metal receptor n=1 Tax=Lipingzhangella rawalii TaxID=2055835 RepID=A0ABU2H2K2_9ACTN|nr:helical backbone metal receptor [Lipingzhangella rawalii]MDS1269532.1 helical backbone metal receptor [Lipingzhangella rawalii]
MSGEQIDDTGNHVAVSGPVRRVVSLVPSLTESLAATAPWSLVGATAWCTHPRSLDVVRVRGTKNPDLDRILDLEPDLVLANAEENRPEDLAALRAAGVPVWVTDIRTLPQALHSLHRMVTVCGYPRPTWLDHAFRVWQDVLAGVPAPREHAVVPIWRRPWMVLGSDTFAGDVLARLGIANLYATAEARYPKVSLAELNAGGADVVVLPDEPYAFAGNDGPECFPALPAALVSGRHLTWYGPSLGTARDVLTRQLAQRIPAPG